MVHILTAVLVMLVATSAAAQDHSKTRSPEWSFAVGAATDNRSKDTSKDGGEPYVYAQAVWTTTDRRFHASPSVETINAGGSRAELAFTGGMRRNAGAFDLDVDAAYKTRLGADAGYDAEAWEVTATIGRSIGPAKTRLQLQYSPDAAGATRRLIWIEARLGIDLSPTLAATVAMGRRDQVNGVDYTGWNLGLAYTVSEDIGLDLRWYDTDADTEVADGQYDGALVLAVDVSF